MNAIKTTLLGFCMVATSSAMYAQGMHSNQRTVPASVKESFHKDYPDADGASWKYSGGKWHTDFKKMDENVMADAYYDQKGRRIDTRMPVAQNAVPEKVMKRVNERYPGRDYRFTKIDRRGKKDLYMVRFKQRSGYKTFYVDGRGRETSYAG